MKDKKVLRKNSKNTRYFLNAAKVVAVITALVFLVTFSRGTVNAAISKEISNQYQDKQLDVLKKNVNKHGLNLIGKLIKISGDNVVSNDNQKDYSKIKFELSQRTKRSQMIDQLYDGKSNYVDNVTTKKLDTIDQKLLKETNQDVYQKQKNKLDTIRIWFEQTQDAIKYVDKIWNGFNDEQSSLSIKNISLVNTYNKLIKNKTVKNELSDKVNEMNEYFNSHSKEDSKVANAKAELADLKNSPLTMKYKPANVDIISSLNDSSKATNTLNNAGITDKHVLYYDKSKEQLSYMTLTNGNYVAEGSFANVISGNVSSGTYTIKQLINSPSGNEAIVTDPSSSSFGKYLSDATDDTLTNMGLTNTDNSDANFNEANPVFWFKNNSALSNSIYFGNSSTIGFIYSGGSSYNNGIQISASDLSTIKSEVSTGLVFYVK